MGTRNCGDTTTLQVVASTLFLRNCLYSTKGSIDRPGWHQAPLASNTVPRQQLRLHARRTAAAARSRDLRAPPTHTQRAQCTASALLALRRSRCA